MDQGTGEDNKPCPGAKEHEQGAARHLRDAAQSPGNEEIVCSIMTSELKYSSSLGETNGGLARDFTVQSAAQALPRTPQSSAHRTRLTALTAHVSGRYLSLSMPICTALFGTPPKHEIPQTLPWLPVVALQHATPQADCVGRCLDGAVLLFPCCEPRPFTRCSAQSASCQTHPPRALSVPIAAEVCLNRIRVIPRPARSEARMRFCSWSHTPTRLPLLRSYCATSVPHSIMCFIRAILIASPRAILLFAILVAVRPTPVC